MADDKDTASPGTEAFVPDFSDDDSEHTGTQSWAESRTLESERIDADLAHRHRATGYAVYRL